MANPILFDDLGEDLERGAPIRSSPPSKAASFGLGFVELYKFDDPELEEIYRDEKFLERAARGRRLVSLFFVVFSFFCGLAFINGNNNTGTLQRVLVPSFFVVGLMLLVVSRVVTKEWQHQWVWFVSGCLMSSAVTTNAIVWKQNYSTEIVHALRDYAVSDPITLFYISELGWFLSVVLVFCSVVMRPRFVYLAAVTVFSFLCFVTGSIIMSPGLAITSLMMRILVFLFLCAFNIKISWSLEQSERTAWFMTCTLERKKMKLQKLLEAEKQKLRREAEKKSAAERILVAYLCHEIRNPFNGVLGFAELTVNTLGKCLTEPLEPRKQLGQHTKVSSPQKNIKQAQSWCTNIVANR
jgi:hypothetical protein